MQQFSNEERAEIARRSGRELYAPLPSIVFALDEPFNDLLLPKSTEGIGYGYVLEQYVQPDMIDPYSRAVIEALLVK